MLVDSSAGDAAMQTKCLVRVVIILMLFSCALANAQQQTWVGYVTDTHCGTNCQVTKNMTPDLKCIRRCVKKGSKYGLWSGDKVYMLEPQAKAMQFAAKNVKVTGTMSGDAIRVAAIETVEMRADRKP
jgi:hypothetical protein